MNRMEKKKKKLIQCNVTYKKFKIKKKKKERERMWLIVVGLTTQITYK